jgi:hypothetical protein
MINEILTPLGVPYRETMFSRAPAGDYAVYMDDVTADGPDDENRIFTHDITVELYEAKPNPKLEQTFEGLLNSSGIKWTKQSRYWIPEAQRYQVIYEFTYITKT